jgi:hypothetical protein
MDKQDNSPPSYESNGNQNKKRKAEELEGDTIQMDSFKRTLLNSDPFVCDSNAVTTLILGNI